MTCKTGPLAFFNNVIQRYTQKLQHFSSRSYRNKEQIEGKDILREKEREIHFPNWKTGVLLLNELHIKDKKLKKNL